MPFKHQDKSYRVRDGIRFICDGDILDQAQGDLKEQAKKRVAVLRQVGHKAFYEKHDGYYRLFVAA